MSNKYTKENKNKRGMEQSFKEGISCVGISIGYTNSAKEKEYNKDKLVI